MERDFAFHEFQFLKHLGEELGEALAHLLCLQLAFLGQKSIHAPDRSIL